VFDGGLELDDHVLKIFKSRLGLRHLLLQQGVDPKVPWFSDICAYSLEAFYARSWDEISGKMPDSTSGTDSQIVLKAWSEKDPLRKAVISAGLPPEKIKDLQEHNITHPKDLTEKVVQDIIKSKNLPPRESSALTRLYKKESSVEANNAEDKKKKAEEMAKKTAAAIQKVKELKDATSAADKTAADKVKANLAEISALLEIPEWRLKPEDISFEKLQDLEKDLEDEQKEFKNSAAGGIFQSDEDLIASISGGQALRGIYWGIGYGPLGKNASHTFLARPDYCPLKGKVTPGQTQSLTFQSSSAAAGFQKTVAMSGLSIAASLEASGYGFSAAVSHSQAEEQVDTSSTTHKRMSKTSSLIQYLALPIKSFQIPKTQMKLSQEAEASANMVTTLAKAGKFLEDFGSHVCGGIHEVGGIYQSVQSISTSEECLVQDLQKKLGTSSTTGASVSGGAFGFELGGMIEF
jgi:hypothetical protein